MSAEAAEDAESGRLKCAQILQRGEWERLDPQHPRWKWIGPSDLPLAELLGDQVPADHLQAFPSARDGETIWLYRCQDGGLISYELQKNRWLHTLNGLAAFRERVFQLNLVPIAELGTLLHRNVDRPALGHLDAND